MHIEIKKPTAEELDSLGVRLWPIWEKEESVFDWHYDEREICYLLKGEVEITFLDSHKVSIKAGDLVTFPQGLSCHWHIQKAVKKHYRFQ